VIGEMGATVVVDREKMPGARWFPEAKLNFAENLLCRRIEGDALVFWGEDKVKGRVSQAELHRAVAQTAAALRSMGVVKGDRVAAYLPNMPATVVAMLAAASIGAIFSSASPDFGVQGVLDRFGQIEPKVLVRLRRLLVQRQDHRLPRQGGRDRRAPAVAAARGGRALCGNAAAAGDMASPRSAMA
jgi:acetoacetyl-CoA synthetase